MIVSSRGLMNRRTVVVDDDGVTVHDLSGDVVCARTSMKRCVVEWTYGSPQSGTRRTRYDPWIVRFLDRRGTTILLIADGQQFGAAKVHQIAGAVGVPFDSPSGWGDAQRRWSWARLPPYAG